MSIDYFFGYSVEISEVIMLPQSPPITKNCSCPSRFINLLKILATIVGLIPGLVAALEKPYPGRDGITSYFNTANIKALL